MARQQRCADLVTVGLSLSRMTGLAAQQEASEDEDSVARLVRPTDAELAERDERDWQERRSYLMSLNAEALHAIWYLHTRNPDHRDYALVRARLRSNAGFLSNC